jgi:hypothetical protein
MKESHFVALGGEATVCTRLTASSYDAVFRAWRGMASTTLEVDHLLPFVFKSTTTTRARRWELGEAGGNGRQYA